MAIIIETDIPAEPIAEEPIDFSGGIPQSPLIPQEALQEGFGISRNPWEIQQENADSEKLQWFSKEQAEVDSAALDPDSYFKNQDISFAGEQKYAQKIVTNDLFLRLQADGGPVPTRGPERELFRSSVAQRLWNGVGAESEEAFHGQVVKDATQRKERKTISDDIYQRATRGALVGAAEPGKEQTDTWQAFRDEVRKKPGYKPEDEPDLYVEWADTQYSAKQSASKFAPQLAEVWSAMKEGGGTPSEIGKATLLDVFTRPMGAPDEYASSLEQEMEKTNATKKAFEIYSQLPDDQRSEFMDALGTLARTLPKEQQASILGGMAKEGGRMVDDYGRGIGASFTDEVVNESALKELGREPNPGSIDQIFDNEQSKLQRATSRVQYDKARDERLAAKSFVSDVRRIEREDFSPTKYYSSASEDVFSWRTAEKGLYAIPGVVTSVGVSVLPVAGPAATYLAMEEFAFDDLRENGMKAGMSARDATLFADEWKSVAAIPQTGLEMLQNFGMVGRLPMVNKALTAIGDRIKAVPLRLAAKTLAANTAETVVEELQFETNYVVQDIAAAFSSDTNTPPAVWYNGKDGAFDGFWNRQATTFLSMLPLAGFAGAGGIDAEARARTFAEATPTQRAAFGIRPEDNIAIDEAKARGQSSLNSAIDIAMQNRQPMADEAKAATEELAAELAEKELSTKQAQIAGTVPQFVQTDQGFSVRDQDGNEIGTSPDSAGALKIAAANSAMVDEDNAEQVAFLGSLLESSSVTREKGETKLVDPFSKVSPTQQAAISQADEARTLQQLQSNEALGRDKFSDIVLGANTTEVKQGVRESVTRLNAGASVLTVVHEDAHTKYRKALAAGRLTQDETAQSLKAFDVVNDGRTTKDGTPLRFLPDNFDSLTPEQQAVAVEEGVSEFIEANTLRTRKNGTEIGNLTTQNITAASKLAPGAVKKFTAFAGAVRDFFGLVFARTAALKQGIREGKIKESDIESFASKLMGLNEQDEYNAAADAQTLDILGSEAETAKALGPAALADAVIANAKKGMNNPEARAKMLGRIADRVTDVKKFLIEADTSDIVAREFVINENFDGAQQEQALIALDEEREAALENHEDAIRLITSQERGAIQDSREDNFAKLEPDNLRGRKGNKAEARRQAAAKVRAEYRTKVVQENARYQAEVAAFDKREAALASRARASDTKAREETKRKSQLSTLRQQKDRQLVDQRQGILNALAIMDGIVGALPVDLRGKIGGYTTLAKLTTNEARLKYLETRMAKVETVVEDYLRKEYGRLFDKLLEREEVKKNVPGKKPTGKVGADVHDLFTKIREAMSWDETRMNAEIAAIDSELNDPNKPPTPEREAQLNLEKGMVALVYQWNDKYAPSGKLDKNGNPTFNKVADGADAMRRASALENATSIFEAGWATEKLRKLLQKEDRDIARAQLKKDTGKAGTEKQRKVMEDQAQTNLGKVKEGFLSFFSWEQFLGWTFGDDSSQKERLSQMEFEASARKEDAVQKTWDAVENLFVNLGGSKGDFDRFTAQAATAQAALKGQELRYELSEVRQDTDANGKPQKPIGIKASNGIYYSQMQAIQATLMWRQPDGQRHMLGPKDDNGNYIGEAGGKWHYDQKFVDSLEAGLTPEAKAVRQFISDQYAAEYDRLNPIYKALYGINLPKNALYAPLTVVPLNPSDPASFDPVTGASTGGQSFTPGSLLTRGNSISQPAFTDALQVFERHVIQMETWMAYAEFVQEASSILNNRDVLNSVIAKGGEESAKLLRGWVEFFGNGGTRDAAAHLAATKLIGNAMNRAAATALVGRASVLAVQSTQLGAALYAMPTGSYVKRFAKLTTGQLGWGEALDSPLIQRRLKQAPPVVRQAMAGLRSGSPNQLKHQVARIGNLIGGADALFTAGTYAMIYSYQLEVKAKEQGLSGAAAEEFARNAAERETDRIAQPTRPGARSYFENTSVHPAMRLGWAFASEPRQKLALTIYALAKKPPAQKARALAVTWLVGSVFTTILRAALRDIRDNGEDEEIFDERNWNPELLALQSLVGPLKGIPFIGDAIEAGLFKAFDQYVPEGNLFSAPAKGVEAFKRVPDWFTGEREGLGVVKDVEAILTAFGLVSDNAAAAGSISHIIRDLFGVAQNVD